MSEKTWKWLMLIYVLCVIVFAMSVSYFVNKGVHEIYENGLKTVLHELWDGNDTE